MGHSHETKLRVRPLLPVVVITLLAGLAWGCDGDNLFAPGPGAGLEIGPSIQFILPDEGQGVALGDSLRVEARITDGGGIASVTYDGVAHRGERELGTHVQVQRYQQRETSFPHHPIDTTLIRYVHPTPEDVAEEVFIRIVAADEAGNVARDSIPVIVGGPSVSLPDLQPGQPVSAGRTLPIRVLASDPAGVELVRVEVTGVVEATFTETDFSGQDPADVESVFDLTIPDGTLGEMSIRASAINTHEIEGRGSLVTVNVGEETPFDDTPPQVSITVEPQGSPTDPRRIEDTDPVRVTVRAQDEGGGTGVREAGYTVRVVRRSNQTDTLWVQETVATVDGQTGTVTRIFDPTMLTGFVDSNGDPFYDPVNLPDTLDLDFFGWAEDAADDAAEVDVPNCAATMAGSFGEEAECERFTAQGEEFTIASGREGLGLTLFVVSGQTVTLPAGGGGSIADAVVHDGNGWLLLSNMQQNRVEVFDLRSQEFVGHIGVGSQPWGLAFDYQNPDWLYVANSGGTNISRVDLGGGGVGSEAERISTPNALLYDVTEELQDGRVSFEIEPRGFSDRPQFVAHDAQGMFVFSTAPTGSAPDGTVRLGQREVLGGPDLAVRLITDHGRVEHENNAWAVAGVDAFETTPVSDGGVTYPGIVAEAHVPGDRSDVRVSDPFPHFGATADAVQDLRDDKFPAGVPELFQPRIQAGAWDLPSIGLSDTTFIAASTDRGAVVLGEGATAGTGRLFYWNANQQRFVRQVNVQDLVDNAAERVMGVALNQDGQLGVGRGEFAVYFFDPDLRLEGEVLIEPGGAGVALHPLHAGGPLDAPEHFSFAFVPVGDGVIEIHGTRHFEQLGRAFIRDTMVGPVRALMPFSDDNDGLNCVDVGGGVDPFDPGTHDECVVVKLSGPTVGGGVAVVDITKADILRDVAP